MVNKYMWDGFGTNFAFWRFPENWMDKKEFLLVVPILLLFPQAQPKPRCEYFSLFPNNSFGKGFPPLEDLGKSLAILRQNSNIPYINVWIKCKCREMFLILFGKSFFLFCKIFTPGLGWVSFNFPASAWQPTPNSSETAGSDFFIRSIEPKLEDDHNFMANGRRPQFCLKMEDDLNFLSKWKTTSI